MTEYNGWRNYDTWHINLVLTNDSETDRLMRSVVMGAYHQERWNAITGKVAYLAADSRKAEDHARYAAAERLKRWVEVKIDELCNVDATPFPLPNAKPYERYKIAKKEQKTLQQSMRYIVKQATNNAISECDWLEIAVHVIETEKENQAR